MSALNDPRIHDKTFKDAMAKKSAEGASLEALKNAADMAVAAMQQATRLAGETYKSAVGAGLPDDMAREMADKAFHLLYDGYLSGVGLARDLKKQAGSG